ncbi:MAG: phosphonoacetaldehyde reductase [Muribaculum sp.]|nr:phosphonoacetaldehyde reductase [Muribaculum sp.]
MTEQTILKAGENYTELDEYLRQAGVSKCMLVCDASLSSLRIGGYLETVPERLGIGVVRFSDFRPNPLYESVAAGVGIFRREQCDMIIAVGGGSAIDVAKCIKLYSGMDEGRNYLEQEIVPNGIKLLAVPTTAGTGSEATRFAVIYHNGEKQSVSHESCIPTAVLMDAGALKTLPPYQRRSTMLDALCHAIEAAWSVNSTAESRGYSVRAVRMIMENHEGYLSNDARCNENMLYAANLAGKAINIAQTTAAHAMCYKLTSLYGISHGHAAALCLKGLWPYMLRNRDKCTDPRGRDHLEAVYGEIAEAMGCGTAEEAAAAYAGLVDRMGLPVPHASEEDYVILKTSVNPVRLKNHPFSLGEETIGGLYREILGAET